MQKFLLLSLLALLTGCAPATTITSAPRSFDRVQVGEAWTIEYILNGMSDQVTFTIQQEARPHECLSCEDVESVADMPVKVTAATSSTGQVWLWNYKSGKRSAVFSAKRLGRFEEANCFVLLGSQQDTFTSSLKPYGTAKSESGTCRVLSVQ